MGKNRFKAPNINAGKEINAGKNDTGSVLQLKPMLSFEFYKENDDCTRDEFRLAHEKLKRLSALTWHQINQAPRQGNGHEQIGIDQLTFTCQLPKSMEYVLSFRSSESERIIGYQDRQILYVLRFTHKHDAYKG